ncbi:glycerophosphodiester phosphodiesterase [Cellulomonas soli]
MQTSGVTVIAHRGNSAVAPQNTIPAFEAAWRAGADMIELDVQLTADGAVVVIHDDDLDETTDGTGPLREHTLAQVRALDAGSWFSPGSPACGCRPSRRSCTCC